MSDEYEEPVPGPHHGSSPPRGLDSGRGRFGRMFPLLPAHPLPADMLRAVAEIMTPERASGANPNIPAGYTYLGQFIGHDITFDPNSQLGEVNDPAALTSFRSPRLDLDSVYGSGPDDQPFLYDWDDTPDPGVKLLVGHNVIDGTRAVRDLPRNDQHRALIGDPRNDVHVIIAQLHLLFIRFHNSVVDHVFDRQHLRNKELFEEARRIVRWHYQWIVVHDFLRRVVGTAMADAVRGPQLAWPAVQRRCYHWEGEPFIPVEFSGAAYRFGHSMVRDTYQLNDRPPNPEFPGLKIFPKGTPGPPETHLTGHRELIPELEIQWEYFYELAPFDPPHRPQPSLLIDQAIAIRLSRLPQQVADDHVLALLDLRRGDALGLPSGPDVARTMGETPLTEAQLFPPALPQPDLTPEQRRACVDATPLWYYVLSEAQAHVGVRLGPVGGRIVAEVLLGLLEADPSSYLRCDPAWVPDTLVADLKDFTMPDLVRFTTEGDPPPDLGLD